MNKSGLVYYNGILAGRIERKNNDYVFTYDHIYFSDPSMPPIALSFPKSSHEFHSKVLFPFFFGLLAEGANKELQCKILKIDEADSFTRLLKTVNTTAIGAITITEEKI
jgi:serine/threonine-protein kinase HipA